MGFSRQNTGLGCCFLLQGIFWSQGSNSSILSLLHWQEDSLSLHYLGSLANCDTQSNLASCLFLSVKFCWNAAILIYLHIVFGCFREPRESCILKMEAVWLTKPEIFTIWPVQKEFADS